uniref:Calcitonin peptide-like domain-containing protein n=1 Tax=Erpetoichthys calabaricus TaxID=27687 RepID=A0A8C4RQH6_ERPCA
MLLPACLVCFFFLHVVFFYSLDRPISKRCSNLSTCVLGKLSQELHKLQTYPRTDVGAGTPGKKRNVVNELESERYVNYGERFFFEN